MYEQLKGLSTFEQVELLTKTLVSYPSYSGTEGETLKANVVQEIIYSFPYFQQSPEHVWSQSILEDLYQRKNVFALIRSNKKTKRTIILHAHIDTVHTSDYGAIQSIAHQPDALLRYFKQDHVPEELKKEAESGDWLFGRGSLDMQSGVAVHLANMLYFSENLDELEGNLLFIFNPDEEAEHVGIKAAVKELYRLYKTENFQFELAINNDFITPLYEGDQTKYIYTGTAGKVLPAFYIQGRESHVGEALTAIDPTVLSSEIVRRVAYNLDFMEEIDGEHVMPPSVLLQRDEKEAYNVQTPLSATLYLNYFIYEKSIQNVIYELKAVTQEVAEDMSAKMQKTYESYCRERNIAEKSIDWSIKVQTFQEFVKELEDRGVNTTEITTRVFASNGERDARQIAFRLIRELVAHDPGTTPRIIVFLATPYLPNHTIERDTPEGKRIIASIEKAANEISDATGEQFAMKRFFPFLADGNFLNFSGSETDLQMLRENFPAQEKLFPIPFDEMKEMQIPAINLGVYGKDGHRWTERVYKPYSFETLPLLIRSVIKHLFRETK
ncbi:M20/M25/M40 family metallo-hydrolase [Bacillus carboniphilus]|uniref:M20/M25/M40 family metallo-hydrolase n=2 Tax=Bacillus carboniphilus TaxID=86663 RepID=A0ABN0WR83_9BACI